jgi:hypothetical protein
MQSRTYTIPRAHEGALCSQSDHRSESRACNEQPCTPDPNVADASDSSDGEGSKGPGWTISIMIIFVVAVVVAGYLCRSCVRGRSQVQATTKAGNTLVAHTTTAYVPLEMAAAVAIAEGR